ncbi:cytochrome P450 monooxygenase [Karstenula rhodostoma CBS 690.94]|uniref:Cytochrome P450 monooxygenase n=1 Tax=Karstenula rhodostoma CBS 690.94 TaxID=1392251 RepID=A0A9P4P9H2_9PLEO|nr:cytochrome P450 monooxygenase [Karstenula rhodostoma CBS 690.94]
MAQFISAADITASSVLKTFASCFLVYYVTSVVYTRYFHALSAFPGPFWASISNFWKLWILSTKQSHTRAIDYHKAYGPVVRVAPNMLVFNDPKLVPIVYHRNADKSDFYSPGVLGRLRPPFQTQDHKEHAAKRKRIAASFQISSLRRIETDVNETIEELFTQWEKRFVNTGKPLDISDWIKWFVYDTISAMAFGKKVGFVEQGRDIETLIKKFHDMAPMAGIVAAIPNWMNPLLNAPILGDWLMPSPGDGTGTGQIMKYRDDMLRSRFADRHANVHGDFLDNLMNAKNADGTYLTEDEIKVECFVLMVAGPDTTAAFIGPFVNYIIQNPKVHARLRREIQEAELAGALSPGVVKHEEAKKLPFFMACVQETLRFSPSTPVALPRIVSPGGLKIEGKYVPEGIEMAANPYVIHRDKGVYGEDAFEYNPERWLQSEERSREMSKYLMSWGYGARQCLGKNVAELMTQKLCLELFRRYEFKSVTPEQPWKSKNLALMIYWDQLVTLEPAQRLPPAAAP